MERQGNAANPARFLRPLHFAVEKHVAYRTENGALYGRPNGMPAVSVCSGLRQAHPRVYSCARRSMGKKYHSALA
jgi:hypothetical protein